MVENIKNINFSVAVDTIKFGCIFCIKIYKFGLIVLLGRKFLLLLNLLKPKFS